MSYDLFIMPKQFDASAIREWFGWRDHYEVSETQAIYSNDDTGVYFSFDIEADGRDEAETPPHIAFNLNYYRPHTFALEAEPEVSAFLQQFDSETEDPQIAQIEGTDGRSYSRQRFLKGWNEFNRYSFKAFAKDMKPPPPWPADPAIIEAIWKWNYGRAALQKVAGGQVFVPRASWFLPAVGEAPVAACTWTDRVPSMIPESLVTHVALVRRPRQTLAGMLGLSRSDQPKFELRLTGVRGVAHMPGMDSGEAHGLPVFYTPAASTPDMNKLFSGAWPAEAAAIVPTEQICGADLIALMKPKNES